MNLLLLKDTTRTTPDCEDRSLDSHFSSSSMAYSTFLPSVYYCTVQYGERDVAERGDV